MEQYEEKLKKVAATLEKYKKNKTLVPPEDLAGKYKVPFGNLKKQLAKELSEFLKVYSLEGLAIRNDDSEAHKEFTDSVERIFERTDIGRQVGKAAFEKFDLEKVVRLAGELKNRVITEAWGPYFQKFICLYAIPECFDPKNPQTPRIYNSLVDKFWDEDTKEWISDEAVKQPAILVYLEGESNDQGN